MKFGNDNGSENNHSGDESDPNDFFNDQLVVLVQHRGSDDELVIGLDDGLDVTNSDVITNGEDEDLLDIPFARNGSITTVGVVSEGNMAFNSVSAMDPSVSSLVSSSLGDDAAVDDIDNENGKSKSLTVSDVVFGRIFFTNIRFKLLGGVNHFSSLVNPFSSLVNSFFRLRLRIHSHTTDSKQVIVYPVE